MKIKSKKLCIWCVTIVLLFVTCLLPYFTQNAFAVTAGDAVIYMDNAAKVQEVVKTFKECVNLQYDIDTYGGQFFFGNTIDSNLFANDGLNASNTDIPTGAWLEKTVQGKVSDGAIWCKNEKSNIVNVFASTLGISWKDLVCNGDKPGMMTMQVNVLVNPDKNIYQWQNTDSACSIGFGTKDYRFAWQSEADAIAYIKTLYENYKNSHPEVSKYLPAWNDLDNFSDPNVAYFVYLNDFKTACTNGLTYNGDLSLINQANYFPAIKEVNPNTGVLEELYYARSITKKDWDKSITGSSGAHTCDTVIAKINEYADFVAQEAGAIVQEAIKEAEEAARERAKYRCKILALYPDAEFDSDGNLIKTIGVVGDEPSAAYYYIKAKKIVDNPDATKADIVKQLRDSLVASNPGLSDAEIDAKIAEQESQINDTFNALLTRAQSIYNKFDKVLSSAGQGVGDGNPETSYWYEDNNGNIACTKFDSFDDTITNDSGYQDILDSLLSSATTSTNPTVTSPTGDPDACTGAAGSLGWILCPVLKMVSEGVDNIYEGYVQKVFLEVDSTELKAEKGYAVYDAWTLIRNMANIIFVILFMVVIFSQLTGIGLTNYGIKKILPKLIMVAVLVNMSFLLCQFAVDISNVLGYSLNKMFDSLGGTVTDMGSSLNNTGSSDLVNWVETFGLLLGITTAGSWMPTFILVLVSAAISVFFGAIVLAARLAGIYILIVLSPAAIVCYALPNSKKIFDRWFKLFIALLIVFPICGALMGGGNFASTILLEVAKSL